MAAAAVASVALVALVAVSEAASAELAVVWEAAQVSPLETVPAVGSVALPPVGSVLAVAFRSAAADLKALALGGSLELDSLELDLRPQVASVLASVQVTGPVHLVSE